MTPIDPIALAKELLLFGNVKTELRLVDVYQLKAGRYQARKTFNQNSLDELAVSIKQTGRNLVPIYARPVGDDEFEIIAGERRWRATQRAGLHELSAIVGRFTDYQCRIIALIENIQREDINPYEEANSIKELADDCGFTQEEVAQRIGKSRSHTGNLLRLLEADAVLQNYVKDGQLLFSHARPLLGISDPYKQAELSRKAVRKQLSSRQIEAMVACSKGEKPKPRSSSKNLDVARFEASVSESSGHPCTITQKASGKGTLSFDWSTPEDLENLISNLRNIKVDET